MKPFDIEIEPDRHLLRLTMRGYWDEPTFSDFSRSFRRALDMLAARGGCFHALVDGRDFAVQSADIARKFGELVAESGPKMAGRTASIVSTTLNKLQANHAGITQAQYFTDRKQAEAWLFSEG